MCPVVAHMRTLIISWSTWWLLQVHLYLYHSGLINFLQFHFNYTQHYSSSLYLYIYPSSKCVLVCSVIYSCVLQVSLSLHSTYSAWRNLWDICASYMHTHCLHHYHAYSTFTLQLPLLQLPLLRLVQVLSSGPPPPPQPATWGQSIPSCCAIASIFVHCHTPPPPHTHTPRTHTCTCSTKWHLYRCPHVPIHPSIPLLQPTDSESKQVLSLF